MSRVAGEMLTQPDHVRDQSQSERDRLVISMVRLEGAWHIKSVYGDDIWWTQGATTNTAPSNTKIEFCSISPSFRPVAKAMLYRYLRRGADGERRPGATTMVQAHAQMAAFFAYLTRLGVNCLGDVTQLICNAYAQDARTRGGWHGQPLKPAGLYKRLKAVEVIFHLSQYTSDPMQQHPWPDSSADHLAGYSRSRPNASSRTPLMPDEVFATLFQRAWEIVQAAPKLLDLRDQMNELGAAKEGQHKRYISQLKSGELRRQGLSGYKDLKQRLTDIRTACYIVVASLSGCRNHELTNLHVGSYYSTVDGDGNRFWWMRSKSTKTFEGNTEWLVPEAAVEALRVMDRWVRPYQESLAREIEGYRRADPADLRIADAIRHLGAVFVGIDKRKDNQVRTISNNSLNDTLKEFAEDCGLEWSLATHQFRRKFANYAARSQFGDLRYLREHFKHWSMDMTLGYALNELQEMALFLDIGEELEDLKVGTVTSWLEPTEPLAGGYGQNLISWRNRNESVTMFKSHAVMIRSIALSTPIRSNGQAWCTASDNLCVGNDLERTRCGDGCDNAVIGRQHQAFYQGLYDHLSVLRQAKDIGPGGQERVVRDLRRCAHVLRQLGHAVAEEEV